MLAKTRGIDDARSRKAELSPYRDYPDIAQKIF